MSLRQFLLILLARKWLMVSVVVSTITAAAIVSLLVAPRYTATASIMIDFKALDPVYGKVLPAALLPGYLATQLDILSSRNVALKAVDQLKLAENPAMQDAFLRAGGNGTIHNWLAESLLANLKLEPSRESSMVHINFRSTDAQFAADAANAFVRAYADTSLALKVEPARQTTAFFDEQLEVLKENLASAQKKLSEFQRDKGITASDERYDVENARLADLSSQLVAAQAQTYESMARRRQVNEAVAKGGTADTLSDVLNNPVVQSIKNSIVQAEAKLSDLDGKKYGKNHPQYVALVAELDQLKRKLAAEMSTVQGAVNTTANVATQREGSLQGALSTQRARVLEMKKQRDEATVLVREVENAQKAYDAATGRLRETRLESQSSQTNISVINPAIVPTLPSFPKMPLNLALACVVGIALAVGLALLAEMMDRVVRCDDDVLEAMGAPLLGRIPMQMSRQRLRSARHLRLTGPRTLVSGPSST